MRAAMSSVFVGTAFRYVDAGIDCTMAIKDYLPDVDWLVLQSEPRTGCAGALRAQNMDGHMINGTELRRRGGLAAGHPEHVTLDLMSGLLWDIGEASAFGDSPGENNRGRKRPSGRRRGERERGMVIN